MPSTSEIKAVMGADLYNAMKRLSPVEGNVAVRVVKHLERLVNQFIEGFKTGFWTQDAQICFRLDHDVRRMTQMLEEDDKKLGEHPSTQEVKGDLKFREALETRAEKILQIMQKLAERQPKVTPKKEFKQLVNDFARFMQMNTRGIAHDFARLGEKAPVKKAVEISPEEKRGMRAAKAELRVRFKEDLIKTGYAQQRKQAESRFQEESELGIRRGRALDVARAEVGAKVKALPAQKAGAALALLLPKIVKQAGEQGIDPHLTDKDKKFLKGLNREDLNRNRLIEVVDQSRQVIALLNRGFFNKGVRVPEEVKKSLDAIRENVQRIEKRAVLVEPKAVQPKRVEVKTQPATRIGRGTVVTPELQARRKLIEERAKALEAEFQARPGRLAHLAAARSLAHSIPLIIRDALAFYQEKDERPALELNLLPNELQALQTLAEKTDFANMAERDLIHAAELTLDKLKAGFKGKLPRDYHLVFQTMRNNIKTLRKLS